MGKVKKVGLALGGGAARGIAHIGVIKALCEYDIPIHCIAGTSAGSMVGGLYAAGLSPDYLVEHIQKLHWTDFASFHFSKKGMFSSAPIENLVRKHAGNLKIKDMAIPFAALATNILTGQAEVLDHPELELAEAIKASASFPGIYDPAEVMGKFYCDGGAGANVPSAVVREMGADVVIAVDVIPYMVLDKPPRHVAALVDRGLDLLLHHVAKATYVHADIMLEPINEYLNSFHFRKGPKLVELGAQCVHRRIEAIKAVIA